jgi:hypothetical protein
MRHKTAPKTSLLKRNKTKAAPPFYMEAQSLLNYKNTRCFWSNTKKGKKVRAALALGFLKRCFK